MAVHRSAAGPPAQVESGRADVRRRYVPGPAINVTGSTADLAVELVGEGRNTTFPVPEHGTVMLVGMFFGTKKLVKLARIVVVAAGASAAVIFFPALPVNPVSKVEVGCVVSTSIFWPAAGWPVLTGPGQITVITALPGGWLLMRPLKYSLGPIGTGSCCRAAADAAAASDSPMAAAIKPDVRAAANRRVSLPRICSSPEISACNFLRRCHRTALASSAFLGTAGELFADPQGNQEPIAY